MARTASPERPVQLLDDIIGYLAHHGLSDMSLRPLARAVGASPRVLLYHFGSKEQLIARVFAELRRRQQREIAALPDDGLVAATWRVWKQLSAPAQLPAFRLFFEALGLAIRSPRRHPDFLRASVEDWIAFAGPSRTLGTVVLAGLRGFLLDLCATGDRRRVDRAVRAWSATLEALS